MSLDKKLYPLQLWLAANLSQQLAPESIKPTDASIKLTENCQARCITCDYWKSHWKDHIDTDAAIHLIKRLGEIGIKNLRFTGGEPLLRRDFFDILNTINLNSFDTIGLQTNGLLLSRFAEKVNSSPITHVSVSLDAIGHRNDQIRGVSGYFRQAIDGLKLIKSKTRIIAVTLNQTGANDLDELIDIVEEMNGFLACNLPDNRLYFLQGALLDSLWPNRETSSRIVATLSRRLRSQFTNYELDFIEHYLQDAKPSKLNKNPPCTLGYTVIYISSDGAVRSGCYVLPPIGNILNCDIEEILATSTYQERVKAMLRLECPGCVCNVFKSLRNKYAFNDKIKNKTLLKSE